MFGKGASMLAPAGKIVRRLRLFGEGIMDMDFIDSPQESMAMRKRHLKIALEMQELGARGLAELRERGEISAEDAVELLAKGLELERTADPQASRKRH